jgi:hypothetical protein
LHPEQHAEQCSNMRKAALIIFGLAVVIFIFAGITAPDEPTEDPQAVPTTPATSTTTPIEPEPEPEPQPEPEPEPQPANGGEIEAWTVCQLFAEQTLANPETVDHDSRLESAGHIGRLWTVLAGLTAENDNGDKQRLDYLCSVRYEPTDDGDPSNDWVLVRLTNTAGQVL